VVEADRTATRGLASKGTDMKLKRLRIENFGSFKDETICFDDYTYYRQWQLRVFAIAAWDKDSRTAAVKQCGARLVMKKFSPFFAADSGGAEAPELKAIYAEIRKDFLPQAHRSSSNSSHPASRLPPRRRLGERA
jgi:beta-lactamase superfamily II metal-dependent hydrolase